MIRYEAVSCSPPVVPALSSLPQPPLLGPRRLCCALRAFLVSLLLSPLDLLLPGFRLQSLPLNPCPPCPPSFDHAKYSYFFNVALLLTEQTHTYVEDELVSAKCTAPCPSPAGRRRHAVYATSASLKLEDQVEG